MRHGEGFDEPFSDTPPDVGYGDYGASFDARLLIGLIVVFLVVVGLFFLADYFGRRHGRQKLVAQRKASARAIYESVRWYLDRALKSSGSVIIERGREVAEVLNARLGYVTDLSSKQYKLYTDLKGALDGMKDAGPVDTTPKVAVPLATDQHQYRVWKALQALDDFWKAKDDKGNVKILAMIEAAQRELSTVPPKPIEAKAFITSRAIILPGKKTAKVAAAAAPAPAATPAPEPAPQPSADETPPPEPTPPPPPPPPKPTKTLPAHKRNMLA